jgi:glycerophosphoryl diester phosphodiesterase
MTYYYDLGVDGLFTDFPDTGVDARNVATNIDADVRHQQCGRPHGKQDKH